MYIFSVPIGWLSVQPLDIEIDPDFHTNCACYFYVRELYRDLLVVDLIQKWLHLNKNLGNLTKTRTNTLCATLFVQQVLLVQVKTMAARVRFA